MTSWRACGPCAENDKIDVLDEPYFDWHIDFVGFCTGRAVVPQLLYCCRSSLLGCIGTHIERPKEEHRTTVVVATSGERKSGIV